MSDELHWLALVVHERVPTELLLDRNRPRKALGLWSLLGAKDSENCCGYLGPTSRRKRPEVPNRMAVALRDVLRPPINELLHRAPHPLPSRSLLVLIHQRA